MWTFFGHAMFNLDYCTNLLGSKWVAHIVSLRFEMDVKLQDIHADRTNSSRNSNLIVYFVILFKIEHDARANISET